MLARLVLVGAVVASVGCIAPRAESCEVGSNGCACTSGGACNPGLTCEANACVPPGGGSSGPGAEEGGDGVTGGATSAATHGTSGQGSDEAAPDSTGTGDLEGCDEDLCVEAYCDNLREYCQWWLSNPDNGSGDITNCDECVVVFMDSRDALPKVYCDPVLQCWVNCIANEGDANFSDVQDCIDEFCVWATPNGTGLCQD